MRYITRVQLKNFQSHEDTTFNLDKSLNAFIGESGHGKSACIKAMEWVIFNKVVGDRPNANIHSKWIKSITKAEKVSIKGETEVHITFDDGIIVSRIKGKESRYEVQVPGKDLKVHTGNGQNVPDEVTEIFKFTDLNIESQADSYFMVFDSPGQIAKRLADVCDLSLGDNVLSKIKSETRKHSSTKKVLEEDITELEETLKDFSDIDKMEEELDVLSKDYEELEFLKSSSELCTELSESISKVKGQLDTLRDLDQQIADIDNLISSEETLSKDIQEDLVLVQSYIGDQIYLDEKITKLSTIEAEEAFLNILNTLSESMYSQETELSTIEADLKKFKSLAGQIKGMPSDEEYSLVDSLMITSENIKVLSQNHIDIAGSLKSFKDNIIKDRDLSAEITLLEEDLKEVLSGECPLCGRSNG